MRRCPACRPLPWASNSSPRRETNRDQTQNRRLPLRSDPLRNGGRAHLHPALPLSRLPTPERCRARPRRPRPQRWIPHPPGNPKAICHKGRQRQRHRPGFCGDCGTPLYVQVATRPDIVGLRVCTLDDPSWFRPDADIFMRSAQPWDHEQPDVPKHDTYPPGQSYPTARSGNRQQIEIL